MARFGAWTTCVASGRISVGAPLGSPVSVAVSADESVTESVNSDFAASVVVEVAGFAMDCLPVVENEYWLPVKDGRVTSGLALCLVILIADAAEGNSDWPIPSVAVTVGV